MEYQNNEKNKLIKFEKYCYQKLFQNYNISSYEFNKVLISNIIYNEKLHIVSCFKEFLIFYDPGEFFADFYKLKESKNKIKTYSEFYSLNSRIFPNYILLSESKYIFNNIKKKQKLLDNIEDENYMKNNNENSHNIIMNYSDLNNAYNFQLNNTHNSYYSTIFTPSIVYSIRNDIDSSIKIDDTNSNISNVNFIIENINKNIKNKGNITMYKTPKNKNGIINDSENKKKTISSIELFNIDKNKKINSTKNNKSKNKIIPNYNKDKDIYISKKNKKNLIDTEISNNDLKKNINLKNNKKNGRKKSKNNIHKKTQSNENIRNEIKIFKDNDTINNKISMLLKTNCEIKSLKNQENNNNNKNKNKKNNNLQKYIQHMTNISKGIEKNNNDINKTMKNNKISLKKSKTSKTNTTYTNKTKSQTSISYRPKKISTIAKSMPKLPTAFENQNKNIHSKNIFHNQLFNFHSNYQSLKNNNLNYNSQIKKPKNKITNRKSSYKIKQKAKEKSLNNFYQIIQKNIDNNIKYNIYNIKNNYIIKQKSQIKNINKNKKNNIIPSLHIRLGNIRNNNNTFIKCYSKSISKSKSKSHSKSKSINRSNSLIKIIDENNKQLQINKNNSNNINKLKIDIVKNIHKNNDGLQTERIKNNIKPNKINTIPKISFDVNMNNNNMNINKLNEYKTTTNNKSYFKGMEQKKKPEMKSLHINFKQANNVHCNYYMNKKIPQSARNKNNINNLNNNKNSNFGSETELTNHHLKPTTHRVFNKFNYPNKITNKNIIENQKEILSSKNKNIYLIHNYNINNINNNINVFAQQNIKSAFNKTISSKRNSINQDQGTNIIININNNIFQNNKNNYNYNNFIYNPSLNNNNNYINNNTKKNNNKILIKNNLNTKNIKNLKDNKQK